MKRGFEGFGVFVDYAVVAIVEFRVMKDLTLPLSVFQSRGGRGRGRGRKMARTCAQSFTKSANAV